MTEEALPKYRVLTAWETHIDGLIEKVNVLCSQGYKIHTFNTEYVTGETPGIGEDRHNILMSLSTPSKYDDISNLQDVAPQDVDEYLERGWRVADSYSKFIRMVKPSE
jgi:hypothetical protein